MSGRHPGILKRRDERTVNLDTGRMKFRYLMEGGMVMMLPSLSMLWGWPFSLLLQCHAETHVAQLEVALQLSIGVHD
jgi:hypothetical protein